MRTAGNLKKERSFSMGLTEQSQSIIRMGYWGSICFGLVDVISFLRFIFFPETFNHPIPPPFVSRDWIMGFLPTLALVVCMGLFAMGIGISEAYYKGLSRDIRRGWVFMLGGPALSLFVGLFSTMDGILGIFTYMISFGCSLYAFLIFRRYLKETALTKPQ
jgi:hypothetical protein